MYNAPPPSHLPARRVWLVWLRSASRDHRCARRSLPPKRTRHHHCCCQLHTWSGEGRTHSATKLSASKTSENCSDSTSLNSHSHRSHSPAAVHGLVEAAVVTWQHPANRRHYRCHTIQDEASVRRLQEARFIDMECSFSHHQLRTCKGHPHCRLFERLFTLCLLRAEHTACEQVRQADAFRLWSLQHVQPRSGSNEAH